MFPQYSIGVDISDAKAFVVCLQKKWGKIRVYVQDVVDFHDAQKLKSRLEILQCYLSDFTTEHKISGADLFIGFPREQTILKVIDLPWAVKENLLDSIGYSLEKYLPLKSDDVYYDGTLIYEDKNKKQIQVMLGAAKKTDMAAYMDFSVSLDAGVSGVLCEPLSVIDYIDYHSQPLFEENENVFIFFIGHAFIDATLVQKRKIKYCRSFECRDKNRIETAVKEEIDRYGQLKDNAGFQTCVLFCGPGIDNAMMDAMDLYPHMIVRKDLAVYSSLSSADYLGAAGLAMSGLKEGSLGRINFLPVSKRRKASKKAVYLMASLVAAASILACVWAGSVIVKQNLTQARLDGQLMLFSEKAKLITKKQARLDALQSKVTAVNSLVETQISLNGLLEELSRILPEDTWLSGFSYSKGKKIRIDGSADAAAQLIPIIEASDLFENCSFLSAIMRTKNKKEKFLIGFDIVGQSGQ